MNPSDPRDFFDIPGDNESPIAYADLSRRDIRSLIFHLLYAAESFDYQASLSSIVDNFSRGFKIEIPMNSDAVTSAEAIIEQRDRLDKDMLPFLSNWRLERIGVCTKLVLRLGIWELQKQDTPATVVINEAIELAKCFAEKDAYRFVNGVLDEFAKAKGYPLDPVPAQSDDV
jgi:N utilization substance protein B